MADDLVCAALSTVGASLSSALSGLSVGLADAALAFTPSRFAGRTHPIVVHFPIALATAAAAIEAWRMIRREHGVSPASFPLLAAAAATGLVATGSGWLNAAWEHGNDTSDLLLRHRWLGTILSAALVGIAFLAWRAGREATRIGGTASSMVLAHRLATFAGAALVGLVGHLGGTLVYGEGYLEKGLFSRSGERTATLSPSGSAADAEPTGTPEEIFYLTSVKPILTTHCEECHGATKQKGDLRLVPIGAAFDGPADTWTIVPGFPDQSLCIERVLLPRDDPDAMPPKGPGLTPAEIQALEQWIRNGAVVPPSERAVDEAASNAPVEPTYTTTSVVAKPSAAVERSIAECLACGAIAQPIAIGSPYFEINASRAEPAWSDEHLRALLGACDAIASLNLAHSRITDAGLASLPPMASLERVRLDHTGIGDVALEPLLSSPKLASVNLVGTAVTDQGLERLLTAPSLRQVYVWGSKVTAEGIARAAKARPEVKVIGAEPPPAP